MLSVEQYGPLVSNYLSATAWISLVGLVGYVCISSFYDYRKWIVFCNFRQHRQAESVWTCRLTVIHAF